MWLVAVLAAVVLALPVAVHFGLPALDHRKHERSLARIAVLERELGIGRNFDDELARASRKYTQAVAAIDEPPSRIYAECPSCKRHVVVNYGACSGGGAKCAKTVWRQRQAV